MKRKHILILCPYPEQVAPTQRLKYEQYFDHFRKDGYVLNVSPFMTQSLWKIVYQRGHLGKKVLWVLFGYLRRIVDLFRTPFYEGVYISLWTTPFGTSFFERLFRLAARKVIYDVDDLVFLGRTSIANRFIAPLKGPSKYIYLMKVADHVITCTPYLDTYVRKFNSKTTDISSTINTQEYVPHNKYTNNRPLVIGWSGSHTTAPYLHLLDKGIRELQSECKFDVLVIGDPSFSIPGVKLDAIGWNEPSEGADLGKIDIGVYPLPEEEWVYGKSGLKALQYMALGIPTVATAIGANFRVIEDGVSGFLVKSPEEWKLRLRELLLDPALRRKLGINGRDRVEKYYSVDANRSSYLKIFHEVYGQPSPLPQPTDNVDWATVEGFGDEWSRFDQTTLPETELRKVFARYFQIFPWKVLPPHAVGFDLGCGTGRWSRFVSERVGELHCIDASQVALEVAKRNLSDNPVCRFHLAPVDEIPLEKESMDFGYSLGVLHHVPDTLQGLKSCTSKLKPGAPFLLYIYYNFENRPAWYPRLWGWTDRIRQGVSRLPLSMRYVVSQMIAAFLYYPLARMALLLEKSGMDVTNFPLSTYRHLSFYTMRVDALDRFGTRLEQRFTSAEVKRMMEEAGLEHITFSDAEPFWCAVGYKKGQKNKVKEPALPAILPKPPTRTETIWDRSGL